MGIESIVDVQISVSGATPAVEDFGTPMYLVYHTVGTGSNLVDEFASLQEAVDAGHTVNSLVWDGLRVMFAQSPRPKTIKVGKRTTPWAQVVRFYPKNVTAGFVYRFRINGVQIAYTVLAGASTGSVAAALATSINTAGGSNWSGAHAGVDTFCTMTALSNGVQYKVTELQPELWIEDYTPAASVAAELAAVAAEDPNWYGLVVDVPSAATISAVSPVIETMRKVYVTDTHDTRVTDGADHTDIGSVVQGLGNMRTYIQFHPDYGAFGAAALLSSMLTTKPGAATWAHKALRSVRKYVLKTAQVAALKAKNTGAYYNIANIGTTLWGQSSGGEFMDIVRGVDWLVAMIQLRVFLLFASNPKVPYTDPGVEQIKKEIGAQVDIASKNPHNLTVAGTFACTAPAVKDVASTDRNRRVLPNVQFTADLQGAIHATEITGTLVQ